MPLRVLRSSLVTLFGVPDVRPPVFFPTIIYFTLLLTLALICFYRVCLLIWGFQIPSAWNKFFDELKHSVRARRIVSFVSFSFVSPPLSLFFLCYRAKTRPTQILFIFQNVHICPQIRPRPRRVVVSRALDCLICLICIIPSPRAWSCAICAICVICFAAFPLRSSLLSSLLFLQSAIG
jgi:hypothetical protein